MDLTLLRSFVVVADTGGITEAAERLSITQPALSRRIQALERYFDTTLLERGRNGVRLTEAGRLIHAEAQGLVTRFDRLRETLEAHSRLEVGTVRIGGGATAVSFLVPPAIASVQKDHPQIRFQVKEAGSQEVERDVTAETLELGIVTLPITSRDLEVLPLFEDRIVAIAGSTHPLVQERRLPIKQIERFSLVGFEGGSAIRQLIDTQLRNAGVEPNVVMELRSIPAILRMVATTGNLAFVSQLGVAADPSISVLDIHDLSIVRELGVITRRGHSLSPAARVFLHGLEAYARGLRGISCR